MKRIRRLKGDLKKRRRIFLHDCYINNRDGRGGKSECKYGVALVHEIYYNGCYEGRTTYYADPLNFCPVCGNKIGKE